MALRGATLSVITPTPKEPIVIRSAVELAALRAGRLRPRKGALRFELPGLDPAEGRRSAERITKLRNECGCRTGSWFAYPAVAGVIAWAVIDPPAASAGILQRLGISLGLVFVAATIGKVVGLTRAFRSVRREIDRISEQVAGHRGAPSNDLAGGRHPSHAPPAAQAPAI